MSTAQNKRHQDMSSMWEEAYSKPREMVQEYPLSSTLLAFGVGVGLGVLCAQTVCDAFVERDDPATSAITKYGKYGRHLVDTLRDTIHDAFEKHLSH